MFGARAPHGPMEAEYYFILFKKLQIVRSAICYLNKQSTEAI